MSLIKHRSQHVWDPRERRQLALLMLGLCVFAMMAAAVGVMVKQ